MAYNIGASDVRLYIFGPRQLKLSVRKPKFAWLVPLALLVAFWYAPNGAFAQDIIGPKTRMVETVTGPYTVIAEAKPLPSLQAANIIVRVSETASGRMADDVKVTVYTSHSGSDETGWAHAISPNVPGVYSATVELKTPGVWDTTLEVEAPDGTPYPAHGFVFEVTTPTTNPEAGYVFIGVAVILVAGASYLVWRIRRNQRERAETRGDTAS